MKIIYTVLIGLFTSTTLFGQDISELTRKAEKGDSQAQYEIGMVYRYGTPISYELAMFWFEKSAKQGNSDSQCELGLGYSQGKGSEIDEDKSIYWFNISADQGNVVAQHNLALIFITSLEESNMKKAITLFNIGANKGYAPSQNALGWLYYSGIGVKKDLQKAFNLFVKSAEQGFETAKVNLKQCDFGDDIVK